MYLNSFNYFRGIAILFIVAGHCLLFAGWNPNSIFGKLIIHLIYGGTSLFVFISGFLFHHIYYNKFDYANFIIKKIKYILCPYLVLSIIPLCFMVFIAQKGPYGEYFFLPYEGIFYKYISPLILYLLTGRTFEAYWYIPFIMVIFALSPIFVRYIELPFRHRITIILLLFCISTVVHRPMYNISIFQSVVYFTPVYLMGMMASIHREKIYNVFDGKELYLLLTAVLLPLFELVYYYNVINLPTKPFDITVIDISIIQKSVMCLFFMVWLRRFEHRQIPYLDKIATASFPIYLLHPIVLTFFKHLLAFSEIHQYKIISNVFGFLYNPVGLFFYFPIVFFASVAIALIIKRVFRSNSRIVVGW